MGCFSERVTRLPQAVADELVVISALAPLMASELSAPWDTRVYTTDSSSGAAAIVSAEVSPQVSKTLWLAEGSCNQALVSR